MIADDGRLPGQWKKVASSSGKKGREKEKVRKECNQTSDSGANNGRGPAGKERSIGGAVAAIDRDEEKEWPIERDKGRKEEEVIVRCSGLARLVWAWVREEFRGEFWGGKLGTWIL